MKALLSSLVFLFSFSAFAAYDQTWHQSEFWAGEYPNGFSVKKEGVTVPARADMNTDLPADISCAVPFRANYHPWNSSRPARYFTASKIVPMIAKENLSLESDQGKKVKVKKGDLIEYLVYGSEGYFTVRYKGKEYGAYQDLLDQVTYDKTLMDTPSDEWAKIPCVGGVESWVLMRDLAKADQEGDVEYLDGLGSWYLGFREYGVTEDLTDEDLKKEEP